jgi:hypothetical protein
MREVKIPNSPIRLPRASRQTHERDCTWVPLLAPCAPPALELGPNALSWSSPAAARVVALLPGELPRPGPWQVRGRLPRRRPHALSSFSPASCCAQVLCGCALVLLAGGRARSPPPWRATALASSTAARRPRRRATALVLLPGELLRSRLRRLRVVLAGELPRSSSSPASYCARVSDGCASSSPTAGRARPPPRQSDARAAPRPWRACAPPRPTPPLLLPPVVCTDDCNSFRHRAGGNGRRLRARANSA